MVLDELLSTELFHQPPAAAAFASPEVVTVPDLLHPTPIRRINEDQTRQSVALAFAAGVSGGVFAEALDHASVGAPSTWEPAAFAGDLFLAQFVSLCFKVRVPSAGAAPGSAEVSVSAKHLMKILASPPADRAVVEYRRTILAELAATPALRSELERLFALICRLRLKLEGAGGVQKWDPNRRHLEILALIKDIIDCTAEGFVSARSGLDRLAAFGRRVQAGEPYRSLSDLLRYDERLATLNLKVYVGADGKIRNFDILAIQEDDKNPFIHSPLRRWLAKLELFIRGFKFSDGEIMARLIDAVFDGIQDEVISFVQLVAEIELYLGALAFKDAAEAAGLAMSLPQLTTADEPRVLVGLFNPLLLAHGVRPVPCNVMIDHHSATVLITGPNSGGKTRLLQSLGLTQLLAQGGLFIPARSGSVALTPSLVMSLIEEARADQSEGRLGTELVRIRALFEKLPPGAMVILDELCSGTNPSEGEEIFELVAMMLTRLSPQAFITTHFLAFAARLEREKKIEGMRFLQVELGEDHRATYQFVPGVAQTSLAGHAAARLGVTRDQLLSLIDRNIASAGRGTR